MTDLLLLATEAGHVAPDHIAAKLAVPLGIVIFCGSVYLLLWANYGAKKGALIYGTAMFAFTFMLGVFWWFGAPGTPQATGLQNFPGQAPDAYFGRWLPCEGGSERCDFYPATSSSSNFQSVAEYSGTVGKTEEELSDSTTYTVFKGDVDQGVASMASLHFPEDEFGGLAIGANRRTQLREALDAIFDAAVDELRDGEDFILDPEKITRQDPFYTYEVASIGVTDDQGVRVITADLQTYANFQDGETFKGFQVGPLETRTYFAVRDPGAMWFPSAVWTIVSLLLFVLCLWRLDAIEQSEKGAQVEADQPEDLAVPVAQ